MLMTPHFGSHFRYLPGTTLNTLQEVWGMPTAREFNKLETAVQAHPADMVVTVDHRYSRNEGEELGFKADVVTLHAADPTMKGIELTRGYLVNTPEKSLLTNVQMAADGLSALSFRKLVLKAMESVRRGELPHIPEDFGARFVPNLYEQFTKQDEPRPSAQIVKLADFRKT